MLKNELKQMNEVQNFPCHKPQGKLSNHTRGNNRFLQICRENNFNYIKKANLIEIIASF